MPTSDAVSRVKWNFECEKGSPFLAVRGLDTYTQHYIEFKVPLHAVPGLVDSLHQLLKDHPDVFAGFRSQRRGR